MRRPRLGLAVTLISLKGLDGMTTKYTTATENIVGSVIPARKSSDTVTGADRRQYCLTCACRHAVSSRTGQNSSGSASVMARSNLRLDVDRNGHGLIATAENHATDWADVLVVAPVGNGQMLAGRHDAIGWVEIHPTGFW